MEAKKLLLVTTSGTSVGDGAFFVVSALYLARVQGFSPAAVGAALTLAWGLGFALSAPMGALADRLGLRSCAVGWSVVVALALAGLALAGDPGTVVVALLLVAYAVAQSGLGGVRQALVAALVEPAERVRLRARLHVGINAGIAAGSALGGVALVLGSATAYRSVLGLDAAAFLAAGLALSRLPSANSAVRPVGPRLAVLRDRPYVALTVLTGVLYLYMPMLSVALPLYVARHTAAPSWAVAVVFWVNTGGVLLLQVRAATRLRSLVSAARAVRVAGLLLAVSCVVFALAARTSSAGLAVTWLLAGAVLQVLGEVLLAGGAWFAGFGLAAPDRPGQWQAMFASAQPFARAVGPVLLVGLVVTTPALGWWVLAGLFLLAGLLFGAVTRWAVRTRDLLSTPSIETTQGVS